MVGFERFFTSYSKFLFLALLKRLVPKSQLDDPLDIKEWCMLADAYIDIIWKIREGLKRDEDQRVIYMHKLCAHFLKIVYEGAMTKRKIVEPQVRVLCSKKYDSPFSSLNYLDFTLNRFF